MSTYDPAAALVDDEEIAFFMADALETGAAAYIAHALGVATRAKGMAHVAGQTGLSRDQLYSSLSENGTLTLKAMLAVMTALGIELTAKTSTHAEVRRGASSVSWVSGRSHRPTVHGWYGYQREHAVAVN